MPPTLTHASFVLKGKVQLGNSSVLQATQDVPLLLHISRHISAHDEPLVYHFERVQVASCLPLYLEHLREAAVTQAAYDFEVI